MDSLRAAAGQISRFLEQGRCRGAGCGDTAGVQPGGDEAEPGRYHEVGGEGSGEDRRGAGRRSFLITGGNNAVSGERSH